MFSCSREYAKEYLRLALGDLSAEFRDGQWEAVESLLKDKSRLLVVQRTGWGKSIVYFLATRMLRDQGSGATLLVSPLLALMRNQIEAAGRLGIRAETINSSNVEKWEPIREKLLSNEVDILLVSPERLANDDFRERALLPVANRIGLFVVDEAHCISDWGHDFRPDYRRIVRILRALPQNIPVLATTATANDRVVSDIVAQLGDNLKVVRGPLARESLRLQNVRLPGQAERLAWLAEQLPGLPGSGIIYTLTVRDARRVADWLRSRRIEAHAYWGSLDGEIREDLERRLISNDLKALVATTALGMGFDKPDLGFVIHFQRPASVVHYYQQVGRAGRAIKHAYGILLSGDEDREITDYFIRTAFPPEGHAAEVLKALNEADDGLSVVMLERRTSLTRTQIEKVLKLLSLESPSPVSRQDRKWFANPVPFVLDQDKIKRLTKVRREEQERMLAYVDSRECLMRFLRRELDDPHSTDCGCCAVCKGEPLIPPTYSAETANEAVQFLRRCDVEIELRRQWPGDALRGYGWSGNIKEELRPEEGRALCLWGDAGWGKMVKHGKQVAGRFSDELVEAAAEMILTRWRPDPFPKWVTCVPSLTHERLVPDFAKRLAKLLRLPFAGCVRKVKETQPQKLMSNSYRQARNLDGAFAVDYWSGLGGPVLLVDDMADSRWTFTVVSALLRTKGSGPVYPMALAKVILNDGDL